MRKCNECGKLMNEGYVVHDTEYYCGIDCLTKKYSPADYYELYEADDAYWTEWDENDWNLVDVVGLPDVGEKVMITYDDGVGLTVEITRRVFENYWDRLGRINVVAWKIPDVYTGEKEC